LNIGDKYLGETDSFNFMCLKRIILTYYRDNVYNNDKLTT